MEREISQLKCFQASRLKVWTRKYEVPTNTLFDALRHLRNNDQLMFAARLCGTSRFARQWLFVERIEFLTCLTFNQWRWIAEIALPWKNPKCWEFSRAALCFATHGLKCKPHDHLGMVRKGVLSTSFEGQSHKIIVVVSAHWFWGLHGGELGSPLNILKRVYHLDVFQMCIHTCMYINTHVYAYTYQR